MSDIVTMKPSVVYSATAAAVMAKTRTAWGRSLQPMSENGALAAPRTTRIAPNIIIRAQTSFGIMPAPGNANVPNGRSPLTANTASAAAMAAPPATWSARRVMGLAEDGGRMTEDGDLRGPLAR